MLASVSQQTEQTELFFKEATKIPGDDINGLEPKDLNMIHSSFMKYCFISCLSCIVLLSIKLIKSFQHFKHKNFAYLFTFTLYH